MVIDIVIISSQGPITFLSLLEGSLLEPYLFLLMYIPLLLTNIISTLIIIHKTWFVLHPIRLRGGRLIDTKGLQKAS